jgi:hypothetical protein
MAGRVDNRDAASAGVALREWRRLTDDNAARRATLGQPLPAEPLAALRASLDEGGGAFDALDMASRAPELERPEVAIA